MNLANIPKFVVNLERRPDRLEHIQKELLKKDEIYQEESRVLKKQYQDKKLKEEND